MSAYCLTALRFTHRCLCKLLSFAGLAKRRSLVARATLSMSASASSTDASHRYPAVWFALSAPLFCFCVCLSVSRPLFLALSLFCWLSLALLLSLTPSPSFHLSTLHYVWGQEQMGRPTCVHGDKLQLREGDRPASREVHRQAGRESRMQLRGQPVCESEGHAGGQRNRERGCRS